MTSLRTILVALVAVGVAGPTLSGCGSGEMEANQDPQNQHDDHNAETDANDGDDGDDGDDLVDPDDVHLIVDFSPTRQVYDVDTSVTPGADVYDGDELMDDPDVDWSVTPEDAVEPDGDDWTIQRADTIDFQACYVDDDGETTSACATRQLVSSGDRRSVVIESPSPGEHFAGTDDETIPVEGTVDEGLAVSSVHVNGQPADVDADGDFSYELTPEFGLNTIVVEATDGVSDDDHTATTNAMWAPEFAPPETDDDSISASFQEALLINLGQQFFDDGEPYTEISDTEVVTEDIADMFALLLEHLDITDEIPDPVVDNDALTLHIDDVLTDDVDVEIWTTDDGIEIFGQLTDLQAHTDGSLSLSDDTVDLGGEVFATASLFVALDIDKAGADDDFDVDLAAFELTVDDAEPAFNDDEANAIFEVADSMLRNELEAIILDSLDTTFIDNLPDMVLEMLESLDEAMGDESFEIDMDFGDPIDVSFGGEVGQFDAVEGQGLDGVVAADVGVDAAALHPDNPGVARLDADTSESPLFNDSRAQIGIDMTLLNTMFHSLWNAGLLDLEITELVPESVEGLIEEGQAEGLMPPVLVPSDGARDDDLGMQLGQLEIELDWMDQQDRFGVNVEGGADLSLADDEIAIDLTDDFDIDVWLIETSEDEPVMEPDEIRNLLETFILPEMEDEIDDNLAFALPLPELDLLEDYASDLAGMTLDVRMNRSPDIRNGYLMFDATLEGEHILE